MANFFRLITAIALFFLTGFAYASFPASPATLAQQCPLTTPHGDQCRAYVAANSYGTGGVCSVRWVNNNSCIVDLTTSTRTVLGVEGWSPAVVLSCPIGSALSGSNCVCSAGYVQAGNSCFVDDTASKAVIDSLNATGDGFCTQNHQVTGLGVCSGGFAVRGSSISTSSTQRNADGSFVQCINGPFTGSGFACSANDATGLTSDGHCKAGKVPGSVNGVVVCVTPGSVTAPSGTASASAPGGSSGSTTSGLGSSAPPSATSATKETTCTGGQCVTTTKYSDSGGTVVGTSQESKPERTFCEENPVSAVCVQSRFTGSTCGASDSCDGDAIQCAIAARSKQVACALSPTPDGSDADYLAAKGLSGKQTGNLPDNGTVNLGAGSFDTSDALGGGSCIADKQVVIAGASISIPFSSVCVHLAMLGNVLLMVSFLLAGRIVVRG